jgi:hypothetical protein
MKKNNAQVVEAEAISMEILVILERLKTLPTTPHAQTRDVRDREVIFKLGVSSNSPANNKTMSDRKEDNLKSHSFGSSLLFSLGS